VRPRIVVFFGTRPEALKLAPVIRALRREPRFEVKTVLTAQHREMIDQVLRLFRIHVDADLDLMKENQTLAGLSQRLLARLDKVFKRFRPNLVVVQGDTTTAFIVSLYAFYHKVPVAHVEAGLRSRNKYHPFPEEINRRLISHLADYHLAPTKKAAQNLLKEGVPAGRIAVTGNTVIDSLFWIRKNLKKSYPRLQKIDGSKRLVLLTAHRRENIGRPLVQIARAVRELSRRFENLEIVYPVHLNPGVQKIVRATLNGSRGIHLLPPLPYDETVYLMNRAYLILTDSGGIQEEAPSLGKPVLVLREVSERPEGVSAGALKVVGTDEKSILREAAKLLSSRSAYVRMAKVRHIYGDGRAARRVVKHLKGWLGQGAPRA
jgi:UDP-N-acetylglucosamine 2-epimerase (non-hydrolysing)